MAQLQIGFIGLGLIGGSIAKAIKENIDQVSIVAYDINKDSIQAAVKDHIVDIPSDSIDSVFSGCDYLFLCAPVQKNDENLLKIKSLIKPGCLLTDVGSVKTGIHEAITAAGLEESFIGGHPMAGSERTGYTNSKSILLQNAFYILTPSEKVATEKVEHYRQLVEKMGAIPLIIDYKQHDHVTAAISHLPHVIAASLVNLVKDSDSKDGIMKMIAAGGFKDITRIASSSPTMWQQICLTNTGNISTLLQAYIDSLIGIKKELDQKDAEYLYQFFDSARIYRDSFASSSSGPIKCTYSFKLDIDDRPGGLAEVVTVLANASINIKNIGITHNREDTFGVLYLEFYDEEALIHAKKILSEQHYSIQD